MRTVSDIDTALRRCLVRRKQGMTHREFEAITNSLLDARFYLTSRPDTGDTFPTREALDGRPRPTTRPSLPAP